MESYNRIEKSTTAKKVKVIFMYYFLICFYVLDYCFFSNRELMMKNDDLGLLLGTMDPNMLTDGTPVDPAVLDDWNSIFKSVPSSDHEFIDLIDSFLEYYEKNEGFDFPFARKILKQNEVLNYVKTAKEKALETCKKYNY